jgi:PPP family 3-phenylpropionic acid transporter
MMLPLPAAPPDAAARRFGRRLALFYGAVFLCFGAHLPFFPVWLASEGLESGWIGLALALPVATRLAAVPVVTRLADRWRALRGFLRLLVVLTLIGLTLTGLAPGPLMIVAIYTVTASAWGAVLPLTDAYALRGVARHQVNYAPIRLWGSAAFVAGALSTGAITAVIAERHLIWVIVAMALLGAAASFLLDPVDTPHAPAAPAPSAAVLWRNRAFWLLLVAAALIQGSHAAYYAFSAVMWRAEGWSGTAISLLWSIGVCSEIALFAAAARLGMPAVAWLALGAAGAVVRWLAMMAQPSVEVLAVVQALHALSFGATHLGTMGLMARLVPGGLTATGQGYLALMTGASMALASLLAGQVHDVGSVYLYALMLGMAAAGAAVVGIAWRRLVRAAEAAV